MRQLPRYLPVPGLFDASLRPAHFDLPVLEAREPLAHWIPLAAWRAAEQPAGCGIVRLQPARARSNLRTAVA